MDQLKDLLVDELQDLLHAETQLVQALPKIAEAAHNQKLQEAIQKHLDQTRNHVERLKAAFELLGEDARPKPCKGMAGIIEEGQESIEELKQEEDLAADLGLIAASQRVEHYEIAAYGTARCLARQIGEREVATLLSHTLGEEEGADFLLSEIAKPSSRKQPWRTIPRASPVNRKRREREANMYHHIKELMYTVQVGVPDSRFGNMLLEQFGGANGELAAAMQYSVQGINCDDPERKDLLMDIGTEEISHLEVVGALARMHLKPLKHNRTAAETDPLIAIAGGCGVALHNSQGNPWTADYLKITGELDVDLRSDIAAEARAKIVYERLIQFTDDADTIKALQFLMTREITHMKAFTAALESLGKDRFSIGSLPPSPDLVGQYFDDSTGVGDQGEPNARGPWNQGPEWELVEAPAFRELESVTSGTRRPNGHSQNTSVSTKPGPLRK